VTTKGSYNFVSQTTNYVQTTKPLNVLKTGALKLQVLENASMEK